ncbi:PDZ domain-containing protein 11-like [Saccoglossus kowalevskii]
MAADGEESQLGEIMTTLKSLCQKVDKIDDLQRARKGHPDYDSDLREFLPRTVKFRRSRYNDQLGFNIRGGKEHRCGIYISKVYPESNAERVGIEVGDKLISVNGFDFEDLRHDDGIMLDVSCAGIQSTLAPSVTTRGFCFYNSG